jgi:hypothetical protein
MTEKRQKEKRAIYGDKRGPPDNDLVNKLKMEAADEIDQCFVEASHKFPKSEYVYIWTVKIFHYRKNHIAYLVRSFRASQLSTRVDTQFASYYLYKYLTINYKETKTSDAYTYDLI